MIKLRSTTFVKAFWFMEREDQNWLGVLMRQEGKDWQFIYRFRYFKDDKSFDSEDTRSWFEVTPGPDASVEKLEASIETIADGLMQAGYSDTLHKLPVDSYGEDAQKALAGAPWVSFREEKVN